ncbi:MAG: DUF4783 domain-containing protein [Rudanella sp.]|nr:DUF4783 domain-containing protein [Rudanella sp.]
MKTSKIFLMIMSCQCLSLGITAPLEAVPIWASHLTMTTSDKSVNEVIKSSFRSGSAQNLAAYFDDQLELFIDTEAVDFAEVRAKHAELILSTFFKKHPPQNFQYVYQGGLARLRYVTGLYQTGGQRFSVYVLMRQDSHNRLLINTLHLRKG